MRIQNRPFHSDVGYCDVGVWTHRVTGFHFLLNFVDLDTFSTYGGRL